MYVVRVVRLYVALIWQRLRGTMSVDSSVGISANNGAEERRRKRERETDLSKDNQLAAAYTKRERERERKRELGQRTDEDREEKAEDDNLVDTRSPVTSSERGSFVAAVMVITRSTTQADAGGNQNNCEVTARTSPRVFRTQKYPAPTDFDNDCPDCQPGLYSQALCFGTFKLDTARFCE